MITFGIWSPDEATFWQSWQTAGIVDENRDFKPEYSEIQITAGAWGGQVDKPVMVTQYLEDEFGNPVLDEYGQQVTRQVQQVDGDGRPMFENVPGWHCNARVFGSLEQQFIYGLNQTDANGNLLDIFDRTWAAEVFQLSEQPEDPETGFPAGYRNNTGVTYTDSRNFSSPSNVWA